MIVPRLRRAAPLHVAAILLAALVLRLAVWWILPYRDWISDEAEYWNAAAWLANGQGFAFFDGWIWTRPPLYLLFLAAHIKLFGVTAMWAARLTQALLGVLLVWQVMRLARRLAPAGGERRVALITGWAMALSYSFASFAFFLLGETYFLVLFVAALLALLRWRSGPHSNPDPRGYPGDPETKPLRRLAWGWLVVAGVLFGLSALTKALVLTFMPIVAIWVLVSNSGPHPLAPSPVRQHGRGGTTFPLSCASARERGLGGEGRILNLLILTLSVCAVVLPWSAYATLRWSGGQGIILVDTTGGYNFALGAQSGTPGGRQENRLHDDLCGGVQCDAQHAARQAEAYAKGWSWIRQNPAGFVAKSGRELLDMVQLQYGGAERLRAGYTQGDVPAPHLLGLLLDDTLYAVAAPLAVVGLLRRQCRPGKGLIAGWLAYNIAVGALVFAINRFRQPLLPFVFIYAACALVQWRMAWSGAWRKRIAYGAAAALGLLILPSYLYWPPILGDSRSMVYETWLGFQGLREAAECRAIETTLRNGDVAGARARHDAIVDADPDPRDCLALVNARILEAEGKIDGPDGALAFLARSNPENDQQQSSRVLMTEGDLLRRLGRTEDAIKRFVPQDVDWANDLPWAWNELPVPPDATRIDLGGGLDIGYIDGFYTRAYDDENRKLETGYRWSGPRSVLRFPGAGTGGPQTLTLRVNPCLACRPRRAVITPSAGETVLPPVELREGWQEIAIELPPVPAGQDVIVTLDNPVFAPGPDMLAVNMRSQVRQPLRLLGTQVDWAELREANQQTSKPANQQTASLSKQSGDSLVIQSASIGLSINGVRLRWFIGLLVCWLVPRGS